LGSRPITWPAAPRATLYSLRPRLHRGRRRRSRLRCLRAIRQVCWARMPRPPRRWSSTLHRSAAKASSSGTAPAPSAPTRSARTQVGGLRATGARSRRAGTWSVQAATPPATTASIPTSATLSAAASWDRTCLVSRTHHLHHRRRARERALASTSIPTRRSSRRSTHSSQVETGLCTILLTRGR